MSDNKTFHCDNCEDEASISNKVAFDNREYCLSCFEHAVAIGGVHRCRDCNNYILSEHTHSYSRNGTYVCNQCIGNDYYHCRECGRYERDGRECICQEDGQENSNRIQHRKFNKKCRTFVSKKGEYGDIIQSSRKFGVEIEMFTQEHKNITDLAGIISKDFGFDHDGSILDDHGGKHPNAIEIVTPIMSGKKGEEGLKELLEQINKKDFQTNESCGLHVHFSASEFKNDIKVSFNKIKDVDENNYQKGVGKFVIKKDLMEYLLNYGDAEKIVSVIDEALQERSGRKIEIRSKLGIGQSREFRQIYVCESHAIVKINDKKIDNVLKLFSPTKEEVKESSDMWARAMVTNDTKGSRYRHPTPKTEPDDYFCQVSRKDNLTNLKTLFYLYTAFQDTFLSMLPNSRRQQNSKVQKLTSKFSLRDIEILRTYEDLETLWFKTGDLRQKESKKHNQYDDSRYYGFNLHTLFGKYGTIEIRHHNGTIDVSNILYWVALHQTIIDKVANGEVDLYNLVEGADLFSIEDRTEYLLNALNLRKGLREYVHAKINHFK